ncbi:MAG: hypothetical protein PHC47_00045, partial [Clostridia bacterium]|nr:hypothetical protein [Clostridia bacterium]
VAGFFGSQASLLSRFVYFAIGMAAFYILATVIKNKGKLKVTENSFKESKKNAKKTNENEDDDENDKKDFKNRLSQNKTNDSKKKTENIIQNQKEIDESENTVRYGYKDYDVTQYDDD